MNQRWNVINPLRHIDVSTGGQDNDCIFIHTADLPDKFILASGEFEPSVFAFEFQ